ncbi:MAG: hypothetical protein IKF19_00100 [Bacilli bacterium]|nr:hypothetical protein [Bacilli bacterium]
MKDRIITLNSGINFYIIEELEYQNKKYILGSKCDLKKEIINQEELDLFEISIKDNNLVLNNVEDKTAQIITSIIIEKIQQNK